jgi:hypothetical protein
MIIHLPAHHIQGSGHHTSIQLTHENPIFNTSSIQNEVHKFFTTSKTEKEEPHNKVLVESCLGSHQICKILLHPIANEADIFEVIVDFPIHHLP